MVFLSKIDPFSEPSEGVFGWAVALRCGLSGLLPSWAKVFACICRATTANRCWQCICISVVLFCIFHSDTKTLQVNHCCSHGTVLGEGRKKRQKIKIKKKTSQSLYVEFKIVINRACWKKNKTTVAFFFCIKENLWQKSSCEECGMCLYFWIWTDCFLGIYFNVK